MRVAIPALLAASLICGPAPAAEPDGQRVVLTLKDHRFTPETVTVPAGQRITIEVVNEDSALEEFDSEDLRVEKDITPHGRASFTVGPLKAGTYSFMGELHADTASGELRAVETR